MAPFVKQVRVRAKAREDGNNDNESELLDLRSSDFEDVEMGDKESDNGGSKVIDSDVAVAMLQLRPVRARQVPDRY